MGIVLLVAMSLTLGCGDCLQLSSGIIINETTKSPIEGVKVSKIVNGEIRQFVYSDSLGRFEIKGISGGIFTCPSMSIKCEKSGYHLQSLIGSQQMVVVMKPIHN